MPDTNQPPVQPIKRRPIVPDGQLQRPRTIERNIRFIFGSEFSSEPATMQVYTATGDLLFNDVIYPDDIIEISEDIETLIFVVNGEPVDALSTLHLFLHYLISLIIRIVYRCFQRIPLFVVWSYLF